MGSLSKRQKEQRKRLVPDRTMSDEQFKWYKYCCDHNIRISPVATADNAVGKWHIGISTPDDYRKVYKSPEICDKHTLWEVFDRYTKYYYDKRKDVQ